MQRCTEKHDSKSAQIAGVDFPSRTRFKQCPAHQLHPAWHKPSPCPRDTMAQPDSSVIQVPLQMPWWILGPKPLSFSPSCIGSIAPKIERLESSDQALSQQVDRGSAPTSRNRGHICDDVCDTSILVVAIQIALSHVRDEVSRHQQIPQRRSKTVSRLRCWR